MAGMGMHEQNLRPRLKQAGSFLLLLSVFLASFVFFSNARADQYQDCMAKLESNGGCAQGSAGYTCVNTEGCMGRYQFCPGTLKGYMDPYDPQKFLNDPALQDSIMAKFTANNAACVDKNLSGWIGKDYKGITITREGLIGASHLLGCAGVGRCLSGGKCTDGYQTDMGRYLQAFSSPDCAYDGKATNTGTNLLCDEKIYARVSEQVNAAVSRKNEFVATNMAPPPSVAQVTNTPCMSKELQRIGNQFSNVPSMYSNQFLGGLLSAGGPISGLMSKMFGAQMQSFTQAAQFLPKMLNFQSMAQSALSSLMDSLGLGDAFSSQLCGLMVDMILKYVQCENPIKLPSLGKLGSLNNLLPKGCAGDALRSTLYQAANSKMFDTVNQPVTQIQGGGLGLGTATKK
ncbi:MAG: hypothetical protein H6866_08370 [Rhodospirillales bacterium]|nr:MAG: hypothetical protein H6866_08370 [Rhodospirillales bacterium]